MITHLLSLCFIKQALSKSSIILHLSLLYLLLYTFPVKAQWDETDKLIADDFSSDALFGDAVSISGNYAVVGAYGDNSFQGAVYVFFNSGSGWSQVQKLTASDGVTSDFFGYSVSIEGDYIIIGAPGSNTFTGSAYIFHKNTSDVWVEESKITGWSNIEPSDLFGWSVSISNNRAVVGAPNYDNPSITNNAGAVFTFDGTSGSGSWLQETILVSGDLADADDFGSSLSLSGSSLVVGARKHDDGFLDAGAAYVFEVNALGWNQIAKLTASNRAIEDFFGHSVDISGNLIVVGAYQKNNSTGSAYIFENSSGWSEVTEINATDADTDDNFGFSVAINNNNALIGAYGQDEPDSGCAYVFRPDGGGVWSELIKLEASDGANGDNLGWAVAINNNYALVGAPQKKESGITIAGAAYLFDSNISLPVSLVSFEAERVDDENISLEWLTASEQNNLGFEIQQSIDGINNFQKIAFVDGAGTRSQPKSYQYSVINSSAAYYRLRQIDIDGKFSYSPIRFVDAGNNELQIKIYPNPTFGQINIDINNVDPSQQHTLSIQLFTLLGKNLLNLRQTPLQQANENLTQVLKKSSAGTYILQISLANKRYTQKIIKR